MVVLDPRVNEWGLPAYRAHGFATIDLRACIAQTVRLLGGQQGWIQAGVAIHIRDPGIVGLILPVADSERTGLVLGNCVGVRQPGDQQPVSVTVWNRNPPGTPPIVIWPGEVMARMVFVPVTYPALKVVEEFTDPDPGFYHAAG